MKRKTYKERAMDYFDAKFFTRYKKILIKYGLDQDKIDSIIDNERSKINQIIDSYAPENPGGSSYCTEAQVVSQENDYTPYAAFRIGLFGAEDSFELQIIAFDDLERIDYEGSQYPKVEYLINRNLWSTDIDWVDRIHETLVEYDLDKMSYCAASDEYIKQIKDRRLNRILKKAA